MTSTQLPYWLAATYLPGIGPTKFLQLLSHFPTIETLFTASPETLATLKVTSPHITAIKKPNWSLVEKDLAWAQTPNHHLIALGDPNYPELLKEISDPPLILYVRGNKAALKHVQLAIVGSRSATPAGLRNAEQFAYHLAGVGFTITSGLALGIDGASHKGALRAKGITLGVCGTGLNFIYPPSHRSLVDEILQQEGAVVSEFSLNVPPKPANFPRRNRIIGGLSVGVLVIEAALKSGSLITARHALEQGREVFAIPGSIHNPQARGCHHLIRQGAKLTESAQDIIEELQGFKAAFSTITQTKTHQSLAVLSAECQALLDYIEYEMTPMDMIVLRSRLTASEVSSILLVLELNGYIESIPGGYIRVN